MNEQQQIRQETIRRIASMLETTPFTFQFKVVKRPEGIKIIYEVTQEQMDALVALQEE
mgnify:CR=1 FL=1